MFVFVHFLVVLLNTRVQDHDSSLIFVCLLWKTGYIYTLQASDCVTKSKHFISRCKKVEHKESKCSSASILVWSISVSVFQVHITQYADSVASHLAKILDSDKHSDVISSAKYVPTKTNRDGRRKQVEDRGEDECLFSGYWFSLLWSLPNGHTFSHSPLQVKETDESVFRGHPQCISTLVVFLWGESSSHYRALSSTSTDLCVFFKLLLIVAESCGTFKIPQRL